MPAAPRNTNASPDRSSRFEAGDHIRKGEDFRRAYDHGQRQSDPHLLVFAIPNGMDRTRIGLSVSKKHGSAVRRNRKKRLLREAFRLNRHALPVGLDLVLIPRQRSDSTLLDFAGSLRNLTRRLAHVLTKRAAVPRETPSLPASPGQES